MTLNLMFASPQAAYLTGDFRFTYSYGGTCDDLGAQKLVPVVKYGLCALISFCGVAKTSNGLDVGQWIDEQVHQKNAVESFQDVLNRIRTADTWLSHLRGDKRLTISIVGFQGTKPFIVCLSNFQNIDTEVFPTTTNRLHKFSLKPHTPHIRIFGDGTWISSADKNMLLRKLSKSNKLHSNEPETMKLLAEANTNASKISNSISSECLVGKLFPTGLGWLVPYGIPEEAEYMPPFMRNFYKAAGAVGFQLKADGQGQPLKPAVVQMLISTNEQKPKLAVRAYEIRNIEALLLEPPANKELYWEL
jgi:hypothetical protein